MQLAYKYNWTVFIDSPAPLQKIASISWDYSFKVLLHTWRSFTELFYGRWKLLFADFLVLLGLRLCSQPLPRQGALKINGYWRNKHRCALYEYDISYNALHEPNLVLYQKRVCQMKNIFYSPEIPFMPLSLYHISTWRKYMRM